VSIQQTELNTETSVDFVRNDACAFKEYAQKTLGIPEDNITLLLDATTRKTRQSLDKMSLLEKTAMKKPRFFLLCRSWIAR
jgi:hypothetical protein